MRILGIALLLLAACVRTGQAQETLEIPRIGYSTNVPVDWKPEPPSNSFRLAQFAIPGSAGPAECVIYYFDEGQGGSVQANIERWQSQFLSASGGPVQPAVERVRVGALPVTLVELQGAYARGVGMGPQGMHFADQIMRAAIVEIPQGRLVVQLFGPRETVRPQRKGFDALVRAIHPSS